MEVPEHIKDHKINQIDQCFAESRFSEFLEN